MSRVYIRVIDRHGESDTVDEVPNSSAFYVTLWSDLLRKHCLHDGTPTLDLKILGRLWSRVAKLPRPDGLVVAATFDRCWFPREMLRELSAALAVSSGSGPAVGRVLSRPGLLRRHDRGVAFSGSIASPWACSVTDVLHRVDDAGHACRDCGKEIQRADHMLAELECCREPDTEKP